MSPLDLWRAPKLQVVDAVVAAAFGLSPAMLHLRSNARDIARPRQIAAWIARRVTTASLPTIGRHFGWFHHTTILHGIRRVEAERLDDADFAAKLTELEMAVRAAIAERASEVRAPRISQPPQWRITVESRLAEIEAKLRQGLQPENRQ